MAVSAGLLAWHSLAPVSAREPLPPPKLVLHKWSGDINVPDPVACTVDPQGRVYVTQTTRRKVADLDIREHTEWIPQDVGMEDVEQKRAFYHDVLAPGKTLRPLGSLKDHNGDGSIDWKDLTVHTERIYRLEDTDGDGVADKKTVFAEGFNTEVTGIAAGILWHDGWIYCTIAPDLWRLRDTNDDGVADEREVVVHGFGHHIAYAGHDMHGLAVGPDGRIYWTIGDKGVSVTTKEGRRVAEPHQGCVLRCEPDGSNFEIFAHGLRNVQEAAFDDYGNLFGVDNDADKPGEKERFVYITERSDSGWRCSYQYMKGYVPWMDEGLWKPWHEGQPAYITPPLAGGHDGPAGFAFNPGTALSSAWRGMFFGNQFPDGKMNGMRVAPAGAAFVLKEDRLVASGVMGIGMSWAPSGKLFMADWAGGYPLDEVGAVWSLDDPAGEGSTERLETAAILKEGFSGRSGAALAVLLGHADQRVRRGAQFALVKQGAFPLLGRLVLDVKQPLMVRLHSLWGLGQGMRAGKYLEAKVLEALLHDEDAAVRALAARMLGDAPSWSAHAKHLVPLLADSSPTVRFHAAISLGKAPCAEAVPSLLELAGKTTGQEAFLRHAVVTGLAGCAAPKELERASSHISPSVRLACLLALRRQARPEAAAFLHDKDPALTAEAARAIYDDASIPEALPALAALLDAGGVLPEAVTRRALNACLRLGGQENARRLLVTALRKEVPLALRVEALELAKVWAAPPVLDRVDGRYRQMARADEKQVMVDAAMSHITDLMALPEKELRPLAVQILAVYRLPVPAPVIAGAIQEDSASPEVRVEALRLLADQHPQSPELEGILKVLLAGKTPEVLRAGALEEQLKRDPAAAIAAARRLLGSGTTRERQKALAILAASQSQKADEVLQEQWDAMLAGGKVPPAIELDLMEAVQARRAESTALNDRLTAYEEKARALAGTLAAYRHCLEGGDIAAGKEIALENLTANCTACHRFDNKEGSNVGPVLATIGKQKDRTYLLEALVLPAAQIAPGFGVMTATLKDGQVVTGAQLSSGSGPLQIRLADGTVSTIKRADIAASTPPMSVMPPMSAMLTPRQIRDLVAYLASLQGSTSPKKSKPPAAKASSPH